MSPAALLRSRPALVAVVVSILALIGCTGSDSSNDTKKSGSSEIPSGAKPQASTARAVEVLLRAEQEGDYAASYALLSEQGRREFPSAAQWESRRAQLPAVTTFSVAPDSDRAATATVRHDPALDAFRGLTVAEELQRWKGREVAGGWLLDADPQVTFDLPSDDAAKDAAQNWAQAVQRCDESAARSYQAVDQLFGDTTAAAGLCGSTGPVAVDAVGRLRSGPDAADIVAQYSTDALTWGRTVDVTTPVTLRVVVAPIGDNWQIIGVFPPRG